MKKIALAVLALMTLASLTLNAQRATKKPAAAAPRRERTVPFALGETLSYDVSWS